MKRKYTVLTAVLSATAVLMAGTWFLSARQSGTDTVETVLAASVSGNVTGISYNTAEEQLRFVLREEQWFWEDDSEFPLSQGYAQTMTSLLQNVTATELVTENCPDFTEYGLEKPKKPSQRKQMKGKPSRCISAIRTRIRKTIICASEMKTPSTPSTPPFTTRSIMICTPWQPTKNGPRHLRNP